MNKMNPEFAQTVTDTIGIAQELVHDCDDTERRRTNKSL
jgi:hypothetical protein